MSSALAEAKMKWGNVKNMGLPEVRGCDGGVVWDSPFKGSNGWEDQGMVEEMLEIGDS